MIKNMEKTIGHDQKVELEKIIQDLKGLVSDILLLDESEINETDSMKSQGFDSISIGYLKDKIVDNYEIELSMETLIQCETLLSLSEYINNYHSDEWSKNANNKNMNHVNHLQGMKLNNVPAVYKNQPIWLLNFYSDNEMDELKDFWERAQNRDISYLKTNHLTSEYFKYIYKMEQGKAAHILVENDDEQKVEMVIMGQGEPIVIIGGIGMTASATLKQAKKWSEKNMVIQIHPPGCGFSDAQELLGVDDISETFFQALIRLGINMPMHLIGYSWGGIIVQNLAYKYKKFVSSVVLSNAVYEVVNNNPELNGDMQMINEFMKIEGGEKYITDFRKSVSLNPKIAMRYDDYYSSDAKKKQSTLDILDKITQPVLIIESEKDGLVSKTVRDEIKNRVKNSEVYNFEDASHFPFFTHADQYNKVVSEFIDKQSGAPRCTEEDVLNELKVNIDFAEYTYEMEKVYGKIADELQISSIVNYMDTYKLLIELCLNYITLYFEKNNYEYNAGDEDTISNMVERFGIIQEYTKLFKYFLHVMEDNQVVQINEGKVLFLKSSGEKRDKEVIKGELIKTDARIHRFLELFEYANVNVSDILSGKLNSYDVIFKGDSLNFDEDNYYTDEKVTNLVVAKFLAGMIKAKKEGRKLRILEIGGGSGRLLRQIYPIVDIPEVEYCFTDVSRYFVARIQEDNLTKHVKYCEYDLFDDIEEQGFERNYYDIILALNVMHVIDNLDNGLVSVKKLLKEGGIGIFMELAGGAPWLDMIWGLLADWWNFNDSRKYSPLMTVEEWNKSCVNCGFKNVKVVPENRNGHSLADVNIVVVQN